MMNTMDRLGMAQHLSRIGLLVDGNSGTSLDQAKRFWLEDAAWQGVRREMENLFVGRDWFETLVAQDLVADGLVYPLFYQHLDAKFAAQYGPSLSSLTDYLMRWYEETAKWVDAVVKTVAAESPANRATIAGWVTQAKQAWHAALGPIANATLGAEGAPALDAAAAALDARLKKLGL
jgi:phenol hydroxylase P1 protein